MSVVLTKQWRLDKGILVPRNAAGGRLRDKEWLAKTSAPGPRPFVIPVSGAFLTAAPVIYGQDSVTASDTLMGYPFYAGYVNGFVSYGSMVARHPGATVLSITVRPGVYGCNVIDVEPGCCTVAETVEFVRNSNHQGMSMPVVYCAAWQGSEIVSYLAGFGLYRGVHYRLWSAHYAGYTHICGPGTCGYAQADMTQYASNNRYDSDVAYTYVFEAAGPPVPVNYPVSLGDTGKLVAALQNGLNKWHARTGSAELTVDSNFGDDTKVATVKAQEYFYQRGVTAGVATQWLMNQLAYPLWPISFGRQGLDVAHLQGYLNKWRHVIGSDLLTPDGSDGADTMDAVAKAQFHFGERGVPAGECTQDVYQKLEADPS